MFNEKELITLLFALKFMMLTPELPDAPLLQSLYDKIEAMVLGKKERKDFKS